MDTKSNTVEDLQSEECRSMKSAQSSILKLYTCDNQRKSASVFVAQITIIFIVIISAILNLSLGNTEQTHLWTSLLSTSLGLLLPNPSIKQIQKGQK